MSTSSCIAGLAPDLSSIASISPGDWVRVTPRPGVCHIECGSSRGRTLHDAQVFEREEWFFVVGRMRPHGFLIGTVDHVCASGCRPGRRYVLRPDMFVIELHIPPADVS